MGSHPSTLSLKNPLIVGSSPLSTRVDTIAALEAAGASAVVLKSLFEEQVRIDAEAFERDLAAHNETSAEATSMFPHLEHAGTRTHAFWITEARKAVKLPLIASINCLTDQQWAEYAKALEGTGVDAIVTATPEHWRSNICIAACKAGKDIYAEKPVTRTPPARPNKNVLPVKFS